MPSGGQIILGGGPLCHITCAGAASAKVLLLVGSWTFSRGRRSTSFHLQTTAGAHSPPQAPTTHHSPPRAPTGPQSPLENPTTYHSPQEFPVAHQRTPWTTQAPTSHLSPPEDPMDHHSPPQSLTAHQRNLQSSMRQYDSETVQWWTSAIHTCCWDIPVREDLDKDQLSLDSECSLWRQEYFRIIAFELTNVFVLNRIASFQLIQKFASHFSKQLEALFFLQLILLMEEAGAASLWHLTLTRKKETPYVRRERASLTYFTFASISVISPQFLCSCRFH